VIIHACLAPQDVCSILFYEFRVYKIGSTVNRCRRLYWNYLWNHPVHSPTPARALSDASDALTWFYVCLLPTMCAFVSTVRHTDRQPNIGCKEYCTILQNRVRGSLPRCCRAISSVFNDANLATILLTSYQFLEMRSLLQRPFFWPGFLGKSAVFVMPRTGVNSPKGNLRRFEIDGCNQFILITHLQLSSQF
jgi:hypothetical protein